MDNTYKRPFLVGEQIYNTKDVYLYATAGYGGERIILPKNTKSIVKKYHYNKKMYIALGNKSSYYDIAWTNKLDVFKIQNN